MKAAIAAGLAAMLLAGCSGNVFVVDNQAPGASDANPGTEDWPLLTIQAAADLAQPGDTILVRPGVYR